MHWSKDPKNEKKRALWIKRRSTAMRRLHSSALPKTEATDKPSRGEKVVAKAVRKALRKGKDTQRRLLGQSTNGAGQVGRANTYADVAATAIRNGELDQLYAALGKAALEAVMEGGK